MFKFFVKLFFIIVISFSILQASFAVENPNPSIWMPYINNLRIRIFQAWRPPISIKPLRTVVLFNVSRNGMVRDIKITQSSGDSEFDSIVVASIKGVEPLEVFPEGVLDEDVFINFTFEFNHNKVIMETSAFRENHDKYIKALTKDIDKRLRCWGKYPMNKSLVLELFFISSDAGAKISRVNVVKSSGNKKFDSLILQRLRNPDLLFVPPPAELNLEQFELQINISNKRSKKNTIVSTVVAAFVSFISSLLFI